MNDVKNRSLHRVLERICTIIPPQESEFADRLMRIADSSICQAPEQMVLEWRKASEAIYDFFGEDLPQEEWGLQLVRIWLANDTIPDDYRQD